MTLDIITTLCKEYRSWFHAHIPDTDSDIGDFEQWLQGKVECDTATIDKFRSKYRDWIGYSMNREWIDGSTGSFEIKPGDRELWIFNHWSMDQSEYIDEIIKGN